METPPLRWTARRKADIVLRLLRGEALDALSRDTAVPVPRLEAWRTQVLATVLFSDSVTACGY